VIKRPRHLLKEARSVWDLTKAGSVTAAARVTAMVITTIIIAVVKMDDTHPMAVATGMALPHHLLRNANLAGVEMIGVCHPDRHQLISLTMVDDQIIVESDQDHKILMADIAALIVITHLRETEQAVVETSIPTYPVTIRIEDPKIDDPTIVDATTVGMTVDQIVEDTTEFVTTMVVEIAVIAPGIVAVVPEVLLATVDLIASGSEIL
jgi:hypothetical protein